MPLIEELSDAVRLCTENGYAVVPRGGGLSYTGGFLPMRADTVIVDLRRLDRVVEINATDMYVTVECGATWKSLYEALKPWVCARPISDRCQATRRPSAVHCPRAAFFWVRPNMARLRIWCWSRRRHCRRFGGFDGERRRDPSAEPFFRNYGPDITGLFLHDAGALGFKARATLRLLRTPEYTGAVSFTFDNHRDMLGAMSEIARRGLAAECFGADPIFSACVFGTTIWRAT